MAATRPEPSARRVLSPDTAPSPNGAHEIVPALALEDVFKIYSEGDIETVALRGAWMSVAPGEIVAVIGPSGSGKSTLLGIAAGLAAPTAGRVFIDGHNLAAMPEPERASLRRHRIGIVFQRDNLIPFLSAHDNVEVAIAEGTGPERRARAASLLERVGLRNRADHRPSQLSGGEQQRVAIAVALANQPGVLLADEPTGELDSATAASVMGLLTELNRELGMAVVLVTHNPELARETGRTVRMLDGLLTDYDPAGDNEAHQTSPTPARGHTAATGEVVLAATDLAKSYPGGVAALRGVSLSVRAGESVAVVGPSGCGKSTLLNLIGGLDRPNRGDVRVGGQRLSELDAGALALLRRRSIGFVFQSHNLIATLNTVENVALPLILDGATDDVWRSRAHELLEAVGLPEVADKLPDQLSGGQRQRVAVARALAHQPRLLLADEPTGSLDSVSAAQVTELLVELAERTGLALVVVTHDPLVAARCHRRVHMADGQAIDPTPRAVATGQPPMTTEEASL